MKNWFKADREDGGYKGNGKSGRGKPRVTGLCRAGRWAAVLLAGFLAGAALGTQGMERVSAAQTQGVNASALELSGLPLTERSSIGRLDFIINAKNVSQYDNATLTGQFSDESGNLAKKAIVIDGTTVNLTIRDVNIDRSTWYDTTAAVELVNGAKLNLTLEGNNILKGALGGAGISVGEGCTLTITPQSTGTLTATGGDFYGGAAGIGANGTGAYQNNQTIDIQKVGTIIIEGGTVNAQGGTYEFRGMTESAAAGIGGSAYGTVGTIIIRGGVVHASSGLSAAGIGGGTCGSVDRIEITGGKVTATAAGIGTDMSISGAAIGSGNCTIRVDTGDRVSCGEISITGGEIQAEGNIGYGNGSFKQYYEGGDITIGADARLSATGTVSPMSSSMNEYRLDITVYDGRLAAEKSSLTAEAEMKNQKLKVGGCQNANARTKVEYTYYSETELLGEQQVRIMVGGRKYQTTVNFQTGKTEYDVSIGEPLYAVKLYIFADDVNVAQSVSSQSVIQGGKRLDASKGEYYAAGYVRVEKIDNWTSKYYVQTYLPAGEQTDITMKIDDGAGNALDVSVKGQKIAGDTSISVLPLIAELTDADETDNLAEVAVSGKKGATVYYFVSKDDLTDEEVRKKAEQGAASGVTSLALTDGTGSFSAQAEDENTDVTCYVVAKYQEVYSEIYRKNFHSGQMTKPEAMLCRDGETQGIVYASLANAVLAAQQPENQGCIVRLQKEVNCETLAVTQGNFTLDLNGQNLYGTENKTMLKMDGGSLTLMNSGSDGVMGGAGGANMIEATGGTLTLQSGSYIFLKYASNYVLYAGPGTDAEIVIKDGVTIASDEHDEYGFRVEGGTLEITGGTFNALRFCYAIGDTRTTISGGSFDHGALYLDQDHTCLTGGYFTELKVADKDGKIISSGDYKKLLGGAAKGITYGKWYEYQKKDSMVGWSRVDYPAGSITKVRVVCTMPELQGTAQVSLADTMPADRSMPPMYQDILKCTFTKDVSLTEDIGTLSYQWYRAEEGSEDGAAIEGATGEEYTVTADDVGKQLYCEVSAEGWQKSVCSDRTAAVTKYRLDTIRDLFRTTPVKYYTGEPVTLTEEDFENAGVGASRGLTLTYGTDYVITQYEKNTNVSGTASEDMAVVWLEGTGDYEGTVKGLFKIAYKDMAVAPTVKGITADGWTDCAELKAPAGYTISFTQKDGYADSIFYTTDTGADGAKFTYYLKEKSTGYLSAKKQLTDIVRVDTTAPDFTGENDGLRFGQSCWKNLEKEISFDNRTTAASMSISATDALSGISACYYYADPVQDTDRYQLLSEDQLENKLLNREFTKAVNGQLTLDQDGSYVVYAYAEDKAGNRSAFICSDGIVLDSTAPVLTFEIPEEHIRDNDAVVEYTMDEPGTIYCFFSMESHDGFGIDSPVGLRTDVTFEELMNASVDEGFEDHYYKGTISVSAEQAGKPQELRKNRLFLNRDYVLHMVAEDAMGNRGPVQSKIFHTKKREPYVAGNPTLTGEYGTKVEDLTITGRVCSNGTSDNMELPGSWSLAADNEASVLASVPSVGEDVTCKVHYTITGDNADTFADVDCDAKVVITPKDISTFTVENIADRTYTGEAQTPVPVVEKWTDRYGTERTLEKDKDYEVSYRKNQDVGTATIIITGKGNYQGTIEKEFQILKNTSNEWTAQLSCNGCTFGQTPAPYAVARCGEVHYQYAKAPSSGVPDDSAYTDAIPTQAGDWYVRAYVTETDNFNGLCSNGVPFTIAKATLANEQKPIRYVSFRDLKGETMTIPGSTFFPNSPTDCGSVSCRVTIIDPDAVFAQTPAVDGDGNLSYSLKQLTGEQFAQKGSNWQAEIQYHIVTDNYEIQGDSSLTICIVDRLTLSVQGTVESDGGNELVYGQKLSGLKLKCVGKVYGINRNEVTGSFVWENPEFVPDVGTTSAAYVFRHSEKESYATYREELTISVIPAEPNVTAPALAGGVTVNCDPTKTLAELVPLNGSVSSGDAGTSGSIWTGGTATWTVGDNEVTVPGSWSWENPDMIPTEDNRSYVAVFTPTDSVNYKQTKVPVTLSFGKATPVITEKPAATAITYGQSLADSVLNGGTANVAGSFAWKDGSPRPSVSDSGSTPYAVIFTPDDSSWGMAETTVTITVNKAPAAPDIPPTAMAPAHSVKTVGEVLLPQGWNWENTDATLELIDGTAVTATAVYNGNDKGNYEIESIEVVLTRSACGHAQTTVNGAKNATCQTEGFTGNTVCRECGAVLVSGNAIPKSAHSYTSTVTKQATTEQEGILTFICSVCGHSYTEAVAKLEPVPAATVNEKQTPVPATEASRKTTPESGEKVTPESSEKELPESGGETATEPNKEMTTESTEAPVSEDTEELVDSPAAEISRPGNLKPIVILSVISGGIVVGAGGFLFVRGRRKVGK